jgi:hypothetical protein
VELVDHRQTVVFKVHLEQMLLEVGDLSVISTLDLQAHLQTPAMLEQT